jgi:acyl carrier protein
MSSLTIEGLRSIMGRCVGDDDSINLDGDLLDTPFLILGYDSLALLETATILKREYGVVIPDDELNDLETPGALLDKVNTVAGGDQRLKAT